MSVLVSRPDGVATTVSDIDWKASNAVLTRAQVYAALIARLKVERISRENRRLTWGVDPNTIQVDADLLNILRMKFISDETAKSQLGFKPYDYVDDVWTLSDTLMTGGRVGQGFIMEKVDGSPITMNANNLFGSAVEGSYSNGVINSINAYLQDLGSNWEALFALLKAKYVEAVSDATSISNMKAVAETFDDDGNWATTVLVP